jgi:phosphoglycerate dehydrogenase-like enzyme
MRNFKIVTDISLDDEIKKLLLSGAAPHEVIWADKKASPFLSNSEKASALADADIAFGQPGVADISAAPNLRWVHLSSAGYTRYDTAEFRDGAKDRKIALTNSSSVYAEPCAEHLLAFMLAEVRRLPAALNTRNDFAKASRHQLRSRSTTLQGQSVVILGFGSIARHLIALLRPFKMKIVAVRRQPKGDEGVTTITPNEMFPAFAGADHVVNLLPGNDDSAQFMARSQFAAMKPGAAFYNIGRGTTVDQNALCSALHSGQVGAAWLDVIDPEPLPADHPLLSAPNCFITPHVGGGHANESEMLVHHFLKNLQKFVTSSPLLDRVI